MTADDSESRRQTPPRPIVSSTQIQEFATYAENLDQLERAELGVAAEEYARKVRESYDWSRITNVDLARVEWRVSSQLCRSGAYCETELDDPPMHTIVLSYPGYRAWGWNRMVGVIRHELAHAVVNERFGDGVRPHGVEFREVAESLDAPLRGEDPVPYRYELFCSRCGSMTNGLYRASDRTRNPWNYDSSCCRAPLRVEKGEGYT